MKITHLIAMQLTDIYEGKNWTGTGLLSTIQDITVEEAVTVTLASANTIASILQHLTFWSHVMKNRMEGVELEIPADNGFLISSPLDGSSWEMMKQDHINEAYSLASRIKDFDLTRLEDPIIPGYSSVYKNFHGTIEHIHYHLGQIVLLKKLLKGNLA